MQTAKSIIDNQEYPIFTVAHEFKYTFDEPILVHDLIESLKAYETLTSSYLPAILNKLLNTDIQKVQVAVSEIERGSLIEDFILKLFFKDAAGFDDFCRKIRKFLKIEEENGEINMKKMIMIAMAALLVVGAYYLLSNSDKNKKEQEQQAVVNNIVTVINANSDTSLAGTEIIEIVKEVTRTTKQKTANNVAKVYAPAQKYGGSVALSDGQTELEPVAQTKIQKLPKEVDLSQTPLTESFSDIDVQIRSTDRDKTTGWHAVIEQIVPKRVKIELPDDIDLNSLANNATIRANVTVVYDLKPNGTRKPKKIILDSLVEP